MNGKLIYRIILLLVLIALAVFAFIHFVLYRFLTSKNELINHIRASRFDVLVFIGIQIIQVVIAFIPGEISGFIGGYLYGPVCGTLYSTIGLTLGSWIAFMLARFFGEPLIARVVKKEVFDKFNYFMEHKGLVVSFLLFLIPGFPKDYLCYIMGASRIPLTTFLVISTIGRFFGTAMLSISGNIAYREQYVLLAIVAVVALVVSVLAWLHHDKLLDILKGRKQ